LLANNPLLFLLLYFSKPILRKLVLVSTPFKRDGWYPEILAGMGQMGSEAAEPMKGTPMYQLYASVAPRPEGG
jgi:hypothetical protein